MKSESTHVNLTNTSPEIWDHDNSIKNKVEQIMKLNAQ
jgi:hypothetical protein